MNKIITIFLISMGLPFLVFAQKNKSENTISISSSVNFYPSVSQYSFFSSYSTATNDELILDYITANSGTFIIEEGDTYNVDRENRNEFPTQILGIGASVRFMNKDALFHEISLTKLASVKSSHFIRYVYFDSEDEQVYWRNLGYEQRSSVIAFRYELGKYFGRKKKNKFRFGFSGGFEPSFFFYNRKSLSIESYPIKAKIISFDVSLAPLFSFKLSKKIFLDIKPITYILVGQHMNVKEKNPFVTLDNQNGVREYNFPELSWALNVQIRYNIKEPSKRRR